MITYLLKEYLKYKIEKKYNVRRQQWDKAAFLRDKEKDVSLKLYQLLKNEIQYNYIEIDECINNYCILMYDISINKGYDNDIILLKLINRLENLDSLGI